MDIQQKLDMLGAAAHGDLACSNCREAQRPVRDGIERWIYPAVRSDGRRVRMLKILQTSACENDCFYCATRRGRDTPRATFQPDELASTFDQIRRANLAEAIFISSAVAGGGTRTMDRMLATAELLRRKYDFRGYLHLKLMPGAEAGAIESALRFADRVSVNLEAPTSEHLARLSSTKRYSKELLAPLQMARQLIRSNPAFERKSLTTQFVVGAAGESDKAIMHRTAALYDELRLARVYYSAFYPVPDTPLDGMEPTPTIREHRLYQSDFLLRRYGFSFGELVFDPQGNLPVQSDPKWLWANHHPELFPIELNTASQEQLLRIPGIGPIGAARIISSRRTGKIKSIEQLGRMGVDAARATPFVLLDGHAPAHQLSLWH